ncbi:MAG: metallophosphoesterase [Bacteroidales bacterium]|nr:metallophosphoesterase [Bacteroidales bacterium]
MKYMFLGMLAAYLAGNVYVFVHMWRSLHLFSPFFRWLCVPLFWFAALSLFIALFARDLPLPDSFFRITYNLGSVWMVFTLYMVIALLVVDLSGIFFPLLRRYAVFSFAAAFLAVVVLLLWGHVNYLDPRVERIVLDFSSRTASGDGAQLRDSASADVALLRDSASADGARSHDSGAPLRIVAVSDLHLGYATGKKALQKYVGKINSLHPDVVLIGGDLIDNTVKPLFEERMWEELGQLEAPGGIYMVPGNHEYISGIDSVIEFISRTPIVLLRDSVAALPERVVIVGRDDRSNRGRKSLEMLKQEAVAVAGTDAVAGAVSEDGPVVILMDHQPYELFEKDSLGFDVQFSGHTHRGQVWPMSLLVDKMYPQSHGYRKWNNSHVVVSSGLSLWGPPFRIGTNSDLWVIDLKL